MIENAYLILWSVLSFWVVAQIWMCQIVIYPLFQLVPSEYYTSYHAQYTKRIPIVVILPGFMSFILPVFLIFVVPPLPLWMHMANIGFGLLGLSVTIFWEIPRHNFLMKRWDPTIIRELIRLNWPRTVSMSAQAVVTIAMLLHAHAL